MKIVVLIVRLLLGLVFFVFGLNAFLQFLKGPIPGGLAGQFLQALFQSHYGLAIGAVQAVGGALLLINRYVPLELTILGPVIVNILLYHLLLNHEGIGGARSWRCSGLRCSSTIASTFPGSLPQRLRPRRDSECSRVYPQSEAVLRGPQALRRGLSALAVWHELTRAPPDLAK